MSRISSMFFIIALICYYVPKLLGKKNKTSIKLHIAAGSISTIAMIIVFIQALGTTEVIKYIGFSLVMIAISITGYLIKKNNKVYRKLHIITTFSFFIYLYIVIRYL